MKKHLIYITILIFSCLNISCSDSDKEYETIYISEKSINFSANKNLTKLISIKAGSNWKATLIEENSWCKIVKEDNNSLKITVDENNGAHKRTSKIEILSGGLKDTILIEQLGSDIDILVDKHFFEAKTVGDLFEIKITTNTEYDFELPNWIQEVKTATRSAEMIDYTHFFNVDSNKELEARQGVVSIQDKEKTITQKIIISQKGLSDYNSEDKEGLVDDIKIQPIKATTSSEQGGTPISLSIDGNLSTFYHSKWNNSADNYFPIDIIYSFDQNQSIDYLIYYPRADQGKNGNFKEVEIWALTDNNQGYTKVLDYDFKGSTSPTRITLDQSITNIKEIKFIVKSGTGDNKGFAACSEMEFYKQNPDRFEYTTLFTDETCSELKPEITEKDIEDCKYPFYKNIAYYMLNNKYDREFRVATFNAYPHPDIQSRINSTGTYSLLDNPTGIYVEKGEDVVVFSNNSKEQNLSILIQNLDAPNGDGYGGPKFPISNGVNRFKAPHKGLLYVMYHNGSNDNLNSYKQFKPVKLHFASGTVNGYFDSQKHTKEDWKRLLDKTTSQYFDLVGKYAHLTYPVDIFKMYTASGLDLINAYDKLVHDEMDFMGLFKYDSPSTPRIYRNRMYFNVMYHSYMYSTSYRTGYNVGTLPELANVNTLVTTSIWGPAHEVGHSNQTSPGLKWVGMTEVTNNIHSQYIQTKFGNTSRLQGEDLGEGRNRFERAMTNMFPTKTFAYTSEPDVFCKLVPLWQLELYFSWVLENKDFYKDLYENVRLKPNMGTAGKNQIWLAYRASQVSGYDLTDFFEKWGFFVPFDKVVEDYWKERMVITPALTDEVKAAIKALNLPKPQHAIEYITDRTTKYYKDNAKLTNGTYSINSKAITTTGCDKAVAFEVFENDKLVFVGTRPSFKVFNEPVDVDQIRVEAISADGSRINLIKK